MKTNNINYIHHKRIFNIFLMKYIDRLKVFTFIELYLFYNTIFLHSYLQTINYIHIIYHIKNNVEFQILIPSDYTFMICNNCLI